LRVVPTERMLCRKQTRFQRSSRSIRTGFLGEPVFGERWSAPGVQRSRGHGLGHRKLLVAPDQDGGYDDQLDRVSEIPPGSISEIPGC
jgi:hypothetical protein